MSDLDTQIRELINALIATSPPPPPLTEPDLGTGRSPHSIEEEPDRAIVQLVEQERRVRSPWRTAIPAMLVTLAMIGGAALLFVSPRGDGGDVAPSATAAPPHVLLPLSTALEASARFEEVAESYRAAYASGNVSDITALFDAQISRQDATFPSVLRGKELVEQIIFSHDGRFVPDCEYRGRYAGKDEGIFVATCSERFGYSFSPDAPLVEISQWSLGPSGLISNWTLHYGLDSLARLPTLGSEEFWEGIPGEVAAARSLLAVYGAAWSSGDEDRTASLYLPQAVRHDSLADVRLLGREAIAAYAAEFSSWYPGASWTLLDGFSNTDGTVGGLYAISAPGLDGSPCEVRVAVLLGLLGDGLIGRETIFYDFDSLVACGWSV